MNKTCNRLTHGHKRVGQSTPEYKTWLGMKARCYRPKNKDFPNWGGRGIAVCERWRSDFSAFLSDMGKKPSPNHSIDRLDSNADYSPENCRWATIRQQGGENRRGLIHVVVDGIEFKTLKSACAHFGVGYTTVVERIKSGIPTSEAFSVSRLKSRRSKESYIRKDLRQKQSQTSVSPSTA